MYTCHIPTLASMVLPVPGAPYSRMPLAVCSRWLLYALPTSWLAKVQPPMQC